MTAYLVMLSIPVLLVLLITDAVAPAMAFFALAFLFQMTGIIDTNTFLTSFVNKTLITLILLLLVSIAIERSRAITYAARHLITKNLNTSLLRLIGFSAIGSAFINNTAVVSAYLSTVARQNRLNPSKLLIPLSYASIIGGITTLIGTSTNLIVNSYVVKAGHEPIHLFTFAAVGIPIALITLPILFFIARRLPERAKNQTPIDKSYFLSAMVERESDLIGKSIRQAKLHDLDGVFLLEIERRGRLISPVSNTEIIETGDILIFTGSVDKLQENLQSHQHLNILGENINSLLSSNLTEVVVRPNADILNQPLSSINFRSMFNAGIVAIHRRGRRFKGNLSQFTIKTGDNLILATGPEFYQQSNIERNYTVLGDRENNKLLDKKHSAIAIIGFAAAILTAAFGLISLMNALFILLAILLFTGCLKPVDLKNRFPFELLLIIGSSLAISQAMLNSGAADIIGHTMQHLFAGIGIHGALIAIYLLTVLLTEIVTNNAAAAIAVPLAMTTANAYGVDIMPFVMTVAYAASACFLMPFGYQTHLMIYSPGSYKIKDYLYTGLPISLAYGLIVILLVPIVFPIKPA